MLLLVAMQGGRDLSVPLGQQGADVSGDQASGMTLIAVLLCTLIRGAKLQEAKVIKHIALDVVLLVLLHTRDLNYSLFLQTRAVALLSKAATMCDDDTRLQRIVPYLLVCFLGASLYILLQPCRAEQRLLKQ